MEAHHAPSREAFDLQSLSFTYPDRAQPALRDIGLTIPRGQLVTLCGPSGSGKTTLLRQLKPALSPHGRRQGSIRFEGTPLSQLSARDQAARIGFVMQSPEAQMVTDKVWHELAFGLESLGLSTPEIRLRVAEMASFFGIESWFYSPVAQLSGGQKQLLALASVMALSPSALLLDEPTSQLDPIAASEFLAVVAKINRELGVTVILSEHRLEEAFPLSDRAIVMDDGRIIADGPPRSVGLELRDKGHGMFLAMPTAMRVWAAVPNDAPCPVTVRDGRGWLSHFPPQAIAPLPPESLRQKGAAAVTLDQVWFRYQRSGPDVIKGLSLTAHYGQLTAVLGGNGTGKTTTLALMAGLARPLRGKVTVTGTVAALPQNPQALFVGKTVADDLLDALDESGLTADQRRDRLAAMARLCQLEGLLDSHPYDLSGGEQQRAALAKVLLSEPQILLLDEPTKGLDAQFKQTLAGILARLLRAGTAIVMVSHDVEFCARYADRCALFFDGSTVSEGTPRAFFSGNSFYTSSANRMARDILPQAITPEELMTALGGTPPSDEAPPTNRTPSVNGPPPSDEAPPANRTPSVNGAPFAGQGPSDAASSDRPKGLAKAALSRRTRAAALMILLLIPLTIFVGYRYLGDRKYLVISLLIMAETLVPFALIFEGRRPQARELVIIAVLCAMGVAGRAAFYMVPQVKPVVAIVIISGVAFGGETGFLVGAMTALVSNFFFGQGPWTPWQMFAFGIIGFLAGVLFNRGWLGRQRVSLALFGGLSAFLIYGGIMNTANVLIYQPSPTGGMFLVSYLQGIPFDLIHGVSTVFFLLVASRPMLDKLDRIKIKYGLIT